MDFPYQSKCHINQNPITNPKAKTMTYWTIRQNPSANTDQNQMRDFIISQNLVTCPFSHCDKYRNNVIDGIFNETNPGWKSGGQDRQFIENIKIGDIVVIPFKGIKECIIARIVSEPIYAVNTGLFTTSGQNGIINISDEGDTPYRPVARRIEIIKSNITFTDKRVLGRASLSRLKNPKILSQLI